MIIVKIVAIALTGAVITALMREYKREFAVPCALITGAVLFCMIADELSGALASLLSLLRDAEVDMVYLDVIVKVTGISYLAKFGAQMCRDAGCSAIAVKVELAAKVLILCLSLPVVKALLTLVIQIIP